MDELVAQISGKAGIDASQARTAVDTVLGFLKQRLPGPIASQLDAALTATALAGPESQAQSALGGLFGGGDSGTGAGGTGGGF